MQKKGLQVLAEKMLCFELLDLIKMTWRPRFLKHYIHAENEQPLAMILQK